MVGMSKRHENVMPFINDIDVYDREREHVKFEKACAKKAWPERRTCNQSKRLSMHGGGLS